MREMFWKMLDEMLWRCSGDVSAPCSGFRDVCVEPLQTKLLL